MGCGGVGYFSYWIGPTWAQENIRTGSDRIGPKCTQTISNRVSRVGSRVKYGRTGSGVVG